MRLQASPRRARCDSGHLTPPYLLRPRTPDGWRGAQRTVKGAGEKRCCDSSRQPGNNGGACSGTQPRGVSRATRETTPQACSPPYTSEHPMRDPLQLHSPYSTYHRPYAAKQVP